MDYALEERIGNPDLFTGRKVELAYFLKWINDIKEKKSQSTAMLARRKMGKTSLMERLFNITFYKNEAVIPFYYEIKEVKMWMVDFCRDFFLSFIYQYIAFKSRKSKYITPEEKNNFEKAKAVEMVYKYSRYFNIPITEETAYLMVKLAEGSPFYISSIIRSSLRNKDLTTVKGLTDTLEFETLNDRGAVRSTWMEYIAGAFPQINDRNAKNIVLHLSKHRDRELPRKDLLEELNLDMTDEELEKKLKALVNADIIKQGTSNYRYRGVSDNIFDKVFRGVYEEEIREFDARMIRKEYNEELEKLKKQYNSLMGKYNCQKGYFAEYLILDQLRLHARKNNELLKSITRYLPDDFDFCDYSRVWKYDISPEYARGFNVDIFARAENPDDYSIIGEVKSREIKKFSKDEVVHFLGKFEQIKKMETLDRAIGFIFSRSGFTTEAEAYCQEKGIACSEDERWL